MANSSTHKTKDDKHSVSFPQYLYNNKLFSDVAVRLEPSGDIYRCHRAVLGTIPVLLEKLKALEEANASGTATPKASVSRGGQTVIIPIPKEHGLVLKLSKESFHILQCSAYNVQDKIDTKALKSEQLMECVAELSTILSHESVEPMWTFVEQSMDANNHDTILKYIKVASTVFHRHRTLNSENYVLPLNRLTTKVAWNQAKKINDENIVFIVRFAKAEVAMMWLLMWGAITNVTGKEFAQVASLLKPDAFLPSTQTLRNIVSHTTNDVVLRFVLSRLLGGDSSNLSIPLESLPIANGDEVVGIFGQEEVLGSQPVPAQEVREILVQTKDPIPEGEGPEQPQDIESESEPDDVPPAKKVDIEDLVAAEKEEAEDANDVVEQSRVDEDPEGDVEPEPKDTPVVRTETPSVPSTTTVPVTTPATVPATAPPAPPTSSPTPVVATPPTTTETKTEPKTETKVEKTPIKEPIDRRNVDDDDVEEPAPVHQDNKKNKKKNRGK